MSGMAYLFGEVSVNLESNLRQLLRYLRPLLATIAIAAGWVDYAVNLDHAPADTGNLKSISTGMEGVMIGKPLD